MDANTVIAFPMPCSIFTILPTWQSIFRSVVAAFVRSSTNGFWSIVFRMTMQREIRFWLKEGFCTDAQIAGDAAEFDKDGNMYLCGKFSGDTSGSTAP